MPRFECADPAERARGINRAIAAVGRHQLVVIPTETSYAVACDAFSPVGVERLNEAKGRTAGESLPVMLGSVKAARAIVGPLHPQGEALIEGFWPGPLTALCQQQSTLTWDIGGDGKHVAVRMPLHPVALEVLQGAGPMVVVAANRVGEPAPRTCDEAQAQLGSGVTVYLDAGERPAGETSTVVDLTEAVPRLLRPGAIPIAACARWHRTCWLSMSDDAEHLADRVTVLMVCTGNIGRSPMMERLMRRALTRRGVAGWFDVTSAGTWAQHGHRMEPGASLALTELGVDASGFSASPLTQKQVAAADLVLVATREHRSDVVNQVPSAVRRTFTLHELARIAESAPPRTGSDASSDTSTDDGTALRVRQAVAWAAQLRGAVPRPSAEAADDLDDPLGAPDAVYRERAMAIEASVERIVPYLLGIRQAG